MKNAIAIAKKDPTFGTVVDDPLLADWLQEAANHGGEPRGVFVVQLREAKKEWRGRCSRPEALHPIPGLSQLR